MYLLQDLQPILDGMGYLNGIGLESNLIYKSIEFNDIEIWFIINGFNNVVSEVCGFAQTLFADDINLINIFMFDL